MHRRTTSSKVGYPSLPRWLLRLRKRERSWYRLLVPSRRGGLRCRQEGIRRRGPGARRLSTRPRPSRSRPSLRPHPDMDRSRGANPDRNPGQSRDLQRSHRGQPPGAPGATGWIGSGRLTQELRLVLRGRREWAAASLARQGWRRTAQRQGSPRAGLACTTPCRAELPAGRCAAPQWAAPDRTARRTRGFPTQATARAAAGLRAKTSPWRRTIPGTASRPACCQPRSFRYTGCRAGSPACVPRRAEAWRAKTRWAKTGRAGPQTILPSSGEPGGKRGEASPNPLRRKAASLVPAQRGATQAGFRRAPPRRQPRARRATGGELQPAARTKVSPTVRRKIQPWRGQTRSPVCRQAQAVVTIGQRSGKIPKYRRKFREAARRLARAQAG